MPNHNKPTTGFHTNPDRINKNGRPKAEWTWSGLLKEMMDESEEDGEPVKVKVARALKLKAYEGDVVAIKEIGNRVEGLPKQVIEQNGTLDVNLTSLTEEQLDEIIRQKSRKAGVVEATGGETAQN